MKKLFYLIFFLQSFQSFACDCVFLKEFNTKEDLKEYDFIAKIKIKEIKYPEYVISESIIHQIDFEILEMYKGGYLKNMLIYGGHSSLNLGWTSCDLGEDINEEWIVFGETDKRLNKIMTGQCSRTTRIKDKFGYENIDYPNKTSLVTKLRRIFDIEEDIKVFENNIFLKFYPNGSKQLSEHYLNNKLHGERVVWFPNEIINTRQFYKDGKKDGEFSWYSSKGDLIKKEKYLNDKPIDSTIIWREVDTSYLHLKIYSDLNKVDYNVAKKIFSKKRIHRVYVYDKAGQLLKSIEYNEVGSKHSESIYFPSESKSIVKYFHKNGNLSSEMFSIDGKPYGLYKAWNENGKLIQQWEFDKNGKTKPESVLKFK